MLVFFTSHIEDWNYEYIFIMFCNLETVPVFSSTKIWKLLLKYLSVFKNTSSVSWLEPWNLTFDFLKYFLLIMFFFVCLFTGKPFGLTYWSLRKSKITDFMGRYFVFGLQKQVKFFFLYQNFYVLWNSHWISQVFEYFLRFYFHKVLHSIRLLSKSWVPSVPIYELTY